MNKHTTHAPIKNIVIIGGGLIGWSAAVGLARGLQGQNVAISLIDIEPIEASVLSLSPQVFDYHRIFALQEKPLFQGGKAKLCLARRYHGFTNSNTPCYLAYDNALPEFHSIELHQVLTWLGETNYTAYSLPALAAQTGTLALPAIGETGIQADFTAGLNIDTQAYKKYMQGAALQLGVKHYQQAITDIALDKNTDFVKHVTLSTGENLATDLVIDNSGTNSKVMNQLFEVEYFPTPSKQVFSARLQAQCFSHCAAKPYTSHIACEQGWLEITTLPNCTTGILHYNHESLSVEQAHSVLLKHIEGELEFTPLPTSPGHLTQMFHKNCVAIGDAAGYIGSPSIDNLLLAQRSITKLLDLFPSKACLPANQTEFNRRVKHDFEQAQDFLQLHYYLAQTSEINLSWFSQPQPLSEALTQRIALFKSSGFVTFELNPMINRQTWINLLFAGLSKNSQFDPLLNILAKSKAKLFLQHTAQQVERYLENFNPYT